MMTMTSKQLQEEIQKSWQTYDKARWFVDDTRVMDVHNYAFKKAIALMQEREKRLVSVLKQVHIPCNHRFSGDCDGCNSEILIWNTLRELGVTDDEA
jgi:hypothetical protein